MSSIIKQQSSGLATETQDGLVSTGTQTFGGDKTFSGNVAVDVQITEATNSASSTGVY